MKTKVSDIFAEEGEQLSGITKNEDPDIIAQLREEVRLLKIDVYKLKSNSEPDGEVEINTNDYFKNMLNSLQGKEQTENTRQEGVNNGNP
ncbi:hypothetical protein J5S76_13235 [Bacillus amyloliquefaciens]|nr:hypothetical protein [Bacillus amyloliquefaciens]